MSDNLRFVAAPPAGTPTLDVEMMLSTGRAVLRIPHEVLADFCMLRGDRPEQLFLAFEGYRSQLWPQLRRLALGLKDGDLYVVAQEDLREV